MIKAYDKQGNDITNQVYVKPIGKFKAFIIKHITHRRAYRQAMNQFKKGGE
jgi:hypothetical protein